MPVALSASPDTHSTTIIRLQFPLQPTACLADKINQYQASIRNTVEFSRLEP